MVPKILQISAARSVPGILQISAARVVPKILQISATRVVPKILQIPAARVVPKILQIRSLSHMEQQKPQSKSMEKLQGRHSTLPWNFSRIYLGL